MRLWKVADQLVINIFGRNFFISALDFHGGDDGRGDSLPKLIAVPQYVLVFMNYLIYRIDKYLYSSRQTRPLIPFENSSLCGRDNVQTKLIATVLSYHLSKIGSDYP